jgi:hypothetical protein
MAIANISNGRPSIERREAGGKSEREQREEARGAGQREVREEDCNVTSRSAANDGRLIASSNSCAPSS